MPTLIGPGDWIGTKLGWTPGVDKGQLVVTLAPDQALLDEKPVEALARYREVVAQFSRPGTLQVAIGSSLDASPKLVPIPSAAADFVSYATAMTAYLGESGPLPSVVTVAFDLVNPVAALPPIQINVTLALAHFGPSELVSPFTLPDIRRVDTRVPANLATGFTAFVGGFHRAFPGLRLAVDGGRLDTGELWVFGAHLTQPTLTGQPTYFAPAPLFTAPQSGEAAVPEFGDFSQAQGWPTTNRVFFNLDGDQLFSGCCEAIDHLLSEPMASAVKCASPTGFTRLAAMRSTLAAAYSNRQLSWLFDQQRQLKPDDPTLSGARATFRGAMQEALRDAYAVDAVVALGASWAEAPAQPVGSELSLLGVVRPTDGSRAVAMSAARLRLHGNAPGTGILYYAFRPNGLAAHASVTVPLEFVVTHIGIGDRPDGAQAWLALMEREIIPVATPSAGLEIPIVNRFAPPTPELLAQRATPPISAPTFAQLLQWEYGTDVVLQPVAQDTATIVVRSNTSPDQSPVTAQNAPALPLAAGLFRFQAGFAQITPVLADLAAGKPTAPHIVEAIVNLLAGINDNAGWAASRSVGGGARTGAPRTVQLTVSLTADQTTAGGWNLAVTADPAFPVGTLSALPCTLAQSPQPNTKIVGTDPLVVSYDPVDASAPVMVRIALHQLPLSDVQTAHAEAQVTRNASLLSPFNPCPPYRLLTEVSRFQQAVAPRVVGPADGYDFATIGTVPDSGLLVDWMLMLLRTILGPASTVRLGLQVGYACQMNIGPNGPNSLSPVTPIVATGVVSIANDGGTDISPAEFAEGVAKALVNWFENVRPSTREGRFVFDLTLRAAEALGGEVLLDAPNLHLGVDRIKDFPSDAARRES
jgi:hypothetical protein